VVELSDGIITSLDDLTTLVAIITEQSKERVRITVKEIQGKNCCLKICRTLPSIDRWRRSLSTSAPSTQSSRIYTRRWRRSLTLTSIISMFND
jgi:hypothetical protein